MAFLKTMIIGSDAPDPVAANTINPLETVQGKTTFGQSQDALAQQQRFAQALAAQNGISNQSQVFSQQQALAGQLQGVADGTGPNPALAQFNQATGQNVANQAALMAGQRGANANVGLLARQIAQNGAGIQQQAAGQSGVMQAQQQLAGMQALQSQQNALAQNANSMVSNQAQAIGGYNQYGLGNAQNVNNAISGKNSADVSSQAGVNAANSARYQADNAMGAALLGGLASAAGAGLVGKFAGAGGAAGAAGGSSSLAGIGGSEARDYTNLKYQGGMINGYANGGAVMPTSFDSKVNFLMGAPMASGGAVTPQAGSAPVPGDSPANDIVPTMLSPQEIVIPRSITLSDNAPAKAAAFVAQILARQNLKRS